MSDILVALIDESPGLPSGVLDILLAQFTHKNAVGAIILRYETAYSLLTLKTLAYGSSCLPLGY